MMLQFHRSFRYTTRNTPMKMCYMKQVAARSWNCLPCLDSTPPLFPSREKAACNLTFLILIDPRKYFSFITHLFRTPTLRLQKTLHRRMDYLLCFVFVRMQI